MKKAIQLLVAMLGMVLFSIPALSGTWTSNNFAYKPSLGARGAVENSFYDASMERIDARLGKEIWVGDPNYGTTLQTALTAIGTSNNVILRVPAGTHSIAADLTVPANVILKVERGATLAIATTKTLIINGGLEAGLYQIFSCTGTGKAVLGPLVKECYPQWFGAKADGATDDGVAIGQAAAALSTAGCKRLLFPPGTYRIYSVGTTYYNMCAFTGFDGLQIISKGAYLQVDPSRTFTTLGGDGDLFYFTACSNVVVDGFRAMGHPGFDRTAGGYNSWYGVEFCRFTQGCTNISMPSNQVNNMISGVQFVRAYNDPESYRCSNIKIGILKTTNSGYGVGCQFSGDNLTADLLQTDTMHRSFMVFGVKNLKFNVISKDPDADDCNISAYHGFGVENLDLTYANTSGGTNSSDYCAHVALMWNDTTGATFRNINIKLNSFFAASGQTGAYGLKIQKLNDVGASDTVDRGHKLEGLTVSGYIEGTPHYTGGGPIVTHPGCMWGNSGTPDVWSNIKFENLKIVNSTKSCHFYTGALVDALTLINVNSAANWRVWRNYTQSPDTYESGPVKVINCSIPNLYNTAYSDRAVVVKGVAGGDYTLGTKDTGKTCTNNGATGMNTITLPTAGLGLEYTFIRTVAQNLRIKPNGSEIIRGGGAGKYLSLDSNGATVILKCLVAGTWEIISSQGNTSFEP